MGNFSPYGKPKSPSNFTPLTTLSLEQDSALASDVFRCAPTVRGEELFPALEVFDNSDIVLLGEI